MYRPPPVARFGRPAPVPVPGALGDGLRILMLRPLDPVEMLDPRSHEGRIEMQEEAVQRLHTAIRRRPEPNMFLAPLFLCPPLPAAIERQVVLPDGRRRDPDPPEEELRTRYFPDISADTDASFPTAIPLDMTPPVGLSTPLGSRSGASAGASGSGGGDGSGRPAHPEPRRRRVDIEANLPRPRQARDVNRDMVDQQMRDNAASVLQQSFGIQNPPSQRTEEGQIDNGSVIVRELNLMREQAVVDPGHAARMPELYIEIRPTLFYLAVYQMVRIALGDASPLLRFFGNRVMVDGEAWQWFNLDTQAVLKELANPTMNRGYAAQLKLESTSVQTLYTCDIYVPTALLSELFVSWNCRSMRHLLAELHHHPEGIRRMSLAQQYRRRLANR